jgi:esterase
MKLHAEILGTGPALLIFHGLFGSGTNWRTLAKSVFAQNFETHLIDQRNHGDSPHDDVFNYDALAEDIIEYIECNNIKAPIALGHSMGGKALMQAAVTRPELFEKIIIVDIAPKAYDGSLRPIISALESLDLSAPNRGELDKALAQKLPLASLRAFLLKNAKRLPEGGFAWKVNLPAISKSYENINDTLDGDTPFMGPTLFIRGAKSDYIQDADMELIREYFPTASLETVAGAGHWVHYEAPKPFVQAVTAFLEA